MTTTKREEKKKLDMGEQTIQSFSTISGQNPEGRVGGEREATERPPGEADRDGAVLKG